MIQTLTSTSSHIISDMERYEWNYACILISNIKWFYLETIALSSETLHKSVNREGKTKANEKPTQIQTTKTRSQIRGITRADESVCQERRLLHATSSNITIMTSIWKGVTIGFPSKYSDCISGRAESFSQVRYGVFLYFICDISR